VFETADSVYFHEAKTRAGGADVRRATLKALAMHAAASELSSESRDPVLVTWRNFRKLQPVVCISSLVEPSWNPGQIEKDWAIIADSGSLNLKCQMPPVVWWGPTRRSWQLNCQMHLRQLTAVQLAAVP